MTYKRLVMTTILLVTSSVATAQQVEKPLSAEQLAHRADEAARSPTATLRYGPDALRSGELRLPKGKGPFPVAIVIHGGCWVAEMGGTGMQGFSEMLRKRGIATWDINYRRVGHEGGGWPGTFQDVATGIDHLPLLAKRHPLDLSRVTAVGYSAGALFSLWAGARRKLDSPWRANANAPRLRSVVAIDGPGALAPMVGIDEQVCGRSVIVPLMGGTPAERPAEYRAASPSEHLPLGVPQLFVLSELSPFMKDYVEQARASGDPVKTLSPTGANHFDIVTAGAPNGEAVADWIKANAFSTAAPQ